MNVRMLLVDKNSRRYRPHADKEKSARKALPDIVLGLERGKCAHYHLYLNPTTNANEKVYCTIDALTDRPNGLLCHVHQQMLFPTKKMPVATAYVEAKDIVAEDTRSRRDTDLCIGDPVKMRKFTNKRPANDWEVVLDQYASDIKESYGDEATLEVLQKHVVEDLGWELFEPRSIHLLKHFS